MKKNIIQNLFTTLFICFTIFAPVSGFAQKGAASIQELSQNLHQAIKANNATILTKYFPSEDILNQARIQGSDDLRALLGKMNASEVSASFQSDFNEMMKLDLAEGWYLAKTTVKESRSVDVAKKEGTLVAAEMALEDRSDREFSIYYQTLHINNRYYYFRSMKVERIGYKYRPNAAFDANTPVKGKVIRGAKTIQELSFALFSALKSKDAEKLDLYIPETLEMDFLRQKGVGPAKVIADSVTAAQLALALKQDFLRVLQDGKGSKINWSSITLKEAEVLLPSIKDGSRKILRIIVQEPEGKETGIVFESIKTKDRHYFFRNMRISDGNAPW